MASDITPVHGSRRGKLLGFMGLLECTYTVLPTSFWKNPELYSKKSENSYRTILNIQRNRSKNPNTRKIGIKRDLQNPYCSDKIRNFGSTAYMAKELLLKLHRTDITPY